MPMRMATIENGLTDDSPPRRNISKSTGASTSRETFSPVRMRPLARAQTMGDIASLPAAGTRRRSSILTTDSQGEKISMRSTVDELLLPTSSTNDHGSGSSHFHSSPLLFAVLPALGGILFEGGGVILTDICIIVLACIFLNWSLRLPWDWYHSSQAIATESDFADHDGDIQDDTITEEEDEVDLDETMDESGTLNDSTKRTAPVDRSERKAAITELNHYQLLALSFCFAGPILGAWLLHSIREQLSRPSEGLISNFNLGIFVLAAELRPTQHVFKLVQSRILYLQRVAAKNPYAEASLDPVALDDLKTRLSELEAHVVSKAEQTSTQEQQSTISTAVTDLRRSIQPELDALNRAVRRYEKRAIALEMQVRGELQDHDQRIRDALALAAAVTRQKKGSFMTILDLLAAVIVLPVQALSVSLSALIEIPRTVLITAYEAVERTLGGRPAWLFPKKVVVKKKERDSSTRRKQRRE